MWYRFFRFITVFILKVFFSLKVEGGENIPDKTNFIVVANHASYLDPFIVGAAIPQRIYWVAIKDLYKPPFVRWFMRRTDTLPVGRSSGELLALITDNKNVGVFPEGTRTHDGQLREFRRGAAMLACRTGRPILPCAIIGSYEALPVKARFPKFLPIKIRIGKPQYCLKEDLEESVDDIRLQEGIHKVRNVIKEMLYA